MEAIQKTKVIWITGLSGSGKTTVANSLYRLLISKDITPVMLDGDQLRAILLASSQSKYSHTIKQRINLAKQYCNLAKLFSNQGHTVIVSTISMFKEIYEWNRKNLEGYFEVYLNVPLEELKRRDNNEIYSRYEAGEIVNVAGIDLNIDEPSQADLVMHFNPEYSSEKIAAVIVETITRKGFL